MSYVFVVCGEAEHVHTLNLSLQYLRRFSKKPITVVTDTARTPEKIIHDTVIDIRTPEKLNDHQASIFLKTSLHRIMPQDDTRYCYLDSDVLAISPRADEIFDQYRQPITFGADHCKLPEFSPYAVHCGCRPKAQKGIDLFNSIRDRAIDAPSKRLTMLNKELDALQDRWYVLSAKAKLLRRAVRWCRGPREWMGTMADYVKKRTGFILDGPSNQWLDEEGQYLASARPFKLLPYEDFLHPHGYRFDGQERKWSTCDGAVIRVDLVPLMQRESEFRWDRKKRAWRNGEGGLVFECTCDHLRQSILAKFDTKITDPEWQHWNGGVFLFDKSSHAFLDTWHDWTMTIFDDPGWQTRDQGTLIATAWKHGLYDHPVLNPRFNLIADYHSSRIKTKAGTEFETGMGFSVDGVPTVIEPFLVHVYHHWGDREWDVWLWLESILESGKKT
jgi:hypothetical protein